MGDPQQVYGDSWLLVYSVDTKNGLMESIQARAEVSVLCSSPLSFSFFRSEADQE